MSDRTRKTLGNRRNRNGLRPGQRRVGQITNGDSTLLRLLRDGDTSLDGRFGVVKQAKSLDARWTSHLADPTVAEETLVGRIIPLTLYARRKERRFLATGEEPDDRYFQAVNAVGRLVGMLPLARRPKDVTPSLAALLADAAEDGGQQ